MNNNYRISFDLFGKRSATSEEPSGENLLDGFTPEQISVMLRVRSAITLGQYSETTPEYRRLMFARWLVEHGRVHD